MINIDSLGLDREKSEALKRALKKDSIFRRTLFKVGVLPSVLEAIAAGTDTSRYDETRPELLEEQLRQEFKEFIPGKDGNLL